LIGRCDMTTPEARLGGAIREAREAAGLSQRALGAAMNEHGFPWHHGTAGRTEGGQRSLPATELVALAELLGTTAAHLLGEATVSQFAVGPLAYWLELGKGVEAAEEAVRDLTEALARARERRKDAHRRWDAAAVMHQRAQKERI
jgi:transcriptional regulator with XRE-family HTH domain